MAQMSNYLENALINATLRGTAYTAPATVYLALYTSDPTDADTGTEVTGGGYARQPATFTAPSNGVTSLSANVSFPQATANWGTVTHVGVRDALTGGNLLYHTNLTTARNILSGDDYSVLAGEVQITLS
ncbi:hypothetical protein SAMN05877753_111152 [Bacillus oleivorans]|uniref:Uncharacterized protein n=1 Tax=Bacillus oleivorans TaxID=1448271 RepID=A0A285D670_9BACI|nr:hypothetical protein [Bacillus oleivorans]SNX75317.1 hypothetical protein SAMN05877753_111152 [Bacillus oleivorans]